MARIDSVTIKLFGKRETVFRVLDASGEVIKVGTYAECAAFAFDYSKAQDAVYEATEEAWRNDAAFAFCRGYTVAMFA